MGKLNRSEKELWWLRAITKRQKQFVVFTVLITAGVSVTYSQCTCAENFEFVYSKTKLNYAGWADKTTPDPQGFASFTEQQRRKASAETDKNHCYTIIHDWLAYFRDEHTRLYNKTPTLNFEGKTNEEIRTFFSATETIPLTEQQVIEQIDLTDALEGIWQNEAYRIAIVKSKTNQRDYAAVVLKADSVYWLPGQVKFELQEQSPGTFSAMFYMRDHALRTTSATIKGNVLNVRHLSSFTKVLPKPNANEQQTEQLSTRTVLQKLNATTFYLRLPTFNYYAKKALDSILLANHEAITATPNLIIDVRDNGGGDDVTYSDVIPYVYTNKIKTINNSILSTPDNIAKFEKILNNPAYTKRDKAYIQKLVKQLKARPNAFYRKQDNTITLKSVLENPKQVVVLINDGCASSCEEFVLTVTQSTKVTLMGDNTMGALDYANVHVLDLPCSDWGLQYATSRTNRLPDYPIDNIGIAPAIRIPQEKNWVEVAAAYFKSK